MINYHQAKSILNKAKIKISNEKVLVKNSINRVDTKNISKKKPKQFKIIGSIAAGNKPLLKKVKKFEAVEIMTGGIIPNTFNTIIPIEHIKFYPNKQNPKSIIIDKQFTKFNHVRFKGSDYKKNQLVVKKGTIIQSNHILALKTLGIKQI